MFLAFLLQDTTQISNQIYAQDWFQALQIFLKLKFHNNFKYGELRYFLAGQFLQTMRQDIILYTWLIHSFVSFIFLF